VKPVRRAVWYGLSTSIPDAGRNQRTLPTSSPAAPSSSARWSQRTPERNRTAESAAAYTSAVPRSGCRKTSTIGTIASPIAVATVRSRLIRCCFSTRKPAIARTKSTLPNSDGWNWNGPSSIQRFDPRTASAKTKTKIISPIVPP
jgi:hypothetical protein